MTNILIGLIILVMLAAGAYLAFSGYTESSQEASEVKNKSQRLDRVATASRGVLSGSSPHDPDSLLDHNRKVDKDFAKMEEQRASANRGRRKTTLVPSLSKFSEGDSFLARMEEDLTQAKSPWRATELVVASIFLTVFVVAILFLFGWSFYSLLALPILALPSVYVKSKKALFYRKFDDQLGDSLMLMANSLRAGFSFMQAMEMVGKESQPPIADEFTRVTQEIAIGVPISDALIGMSERIKSMDLSLVVIAVIIQREVGGALAQLLELISEVIRERQRIKGEIRTLTAQGRLTGGILGLMPMTVGALIYFIGKFQYPGEKNFMDNLFFTSLGHLMLGGAFVWQCIGILLIMKIVSIKV